MADQLDARALGQLRAAAQAGAAGSADSAALLEACKLAEAAPAHLHRQLEDAARQQLRSVLPLADKQHRCKLALMRSAVVSPPPPAPRAVGAVPEPPQPGRLLLHPHAEDLQRRMLRSLFPFVVYPPHPLYAPENGMPPLFNTTVVQPLTEGRWPGPSIDPVLCVAALGLLPHSGFMAHQILFFAAAAAERLRQPRLEQRWRRELAELQQGQPEGRCLSYEQLLAELLMEQHRLAPAVALAPVTRSSSAFDCSPEGGPGLVARLTRAAAIVSDAEEVARLLPSSPKALCCAGRLLAGLGRGGNRGGSAAMSQRALELLRQARQLAGEQRSDLWLAAATFEAAAAAASAGREGPEQDEVQRWVQEGEAALARCRGLLPQQWLAPAEEARARARAAGALAAEAQRQGEEPGSTATAAEGQTRHGRLRQCSSCGAESLTLKACGRCRKRWYCRRECQVAHWRTHKSECRAPGAVSEEAKEQD